MTNLTVAEIVNSGSQFVYRNNGNTPNVVPNVGDALSGYASLPGNGRILAVDGDYIAVAEVDGNGMVTRFGETNAVVYNDASPPTITSQPQGDTVDEGAAPVVLTVEASGDGELSYQWYRNTEDSNAGGFALNGQTNATYTVPTGAARDDYFYVVVTNTDDTVSGNPTASVRSDTAHVVVNALTNATAPTITSQPQGMTVDEGAAPVVLTVEASGDGELSYQWYRNTEDSNAGGFALNGQTNATYTVPTGAARDDYFYVVVTNTDHTVSGNPTASVRSDTAHVVVNALTDAAAPIITSHPQGGPPVDEGATPVELSVTASGTGELSYQWYRNSEDSNAGGSALNGQTNATYTVPTGAARDDYFYVVVTNTDHTVSGNPTASVRSDTAHVVVNALTDAVEPTINLQPQGATVAENDLLTLSVEANVSDEGALSYQWIRNAANSYNGGSFVVGETGSTFTVRTGTAFEAYYYVQVTNTNEAVPGTKIARTNSAIVHVVVEDVTVPTVELDSNEGDPTRKSAFKVTVTFSEPVSGFEETDLTVNNGSLQELTPVVNGLIYTATIAPIADGDVEVSVIEDAVTDKVNNGNPASAVWRIAYDATAPEITLNGEAAVVLEVGTPFVDPGATAWDTRDGDLTEAVVTSGTVQPDTIGVYSLYYDVRDAAGNAAVQRVRTIEMVDTTAPSLTLLGDNPLTWAEGTAFVDPGATAADQYDGDLSAQIIVSGAVDTAQPGSYELAYRVEDSSGNRTEKTRMVKVLSADTSLNLLSLDAGTLSPAFAPDVLDYHAEVSYDVAEVKLSLQANTAATLEINSVVVLLDESGAAERSQSLTTGDNEITIRITSEDGSSRLYTLLVTRAEAAPPTSGGTSTTPLPDNTGYEVMVNGKPVSTGVLLQKRINGQDIVTVVLDKTKLLQRLNAEGEGAVITIPVEKDSAVVVAQLTGDIVRQMEMRQAVLVLETGTHTYTLPAEQIAMDALASRFGDDVLSEDIVIRIRIAALLPAAENTAEAAADNGGFSIVGEPVEFEVMAEYAGRVEKIDAFQAYVERTIALPDGVDPERITTAVVVEADGNVRHVPTRVVQEEAGDYAIINSMTNSSYALIWHPLQFEDTAGHWGAAAIDEMGSRMVVRGYEDGSFGPDREMTRAEFTAAMVRALGLGAVPAASSFHDVDERDWYAAAAETAYAYGLINGYEDGSFRPDARITREQAMLMMVHAMERTGLAGAGSELVANQALDAFSDRAAISNWAQRGVADSVHAGIVQGRGGGLLAPGSFVTRAEAARMLAQLLIQSGLI
ncbi:DUF5011 domain-containing protein [Paenibacillus sp. IB182496]|uniref:DUF5011 domain-containing protein n=2 Tax=Paenibacillus sabuli TaxID=2772509 RepID=A0A927GQS1_9BACL|nr:DUF5011 domain-containing protein [Paenibacillus sabuli]